MHVVDHQVAVVVSKTRWRERERDKPTASAVSANHQPTIDSEVYSMGMVELLHVRFTFLDDAFYFS